MNLQFMETTAYSCIIYRFREVHLLVGPALEGSSGKLKVTDSISARCVCKAPCHLHPESSAHTLPNKVTDTFARRYDGRHGAWVAVASRTLTAE